MVTTVRRFRAIPTLWKSARPRLYWLAVFALPIVVAACNKTGTGSGY